MAYFRSHKKGSGGGGSGLPILKGTTDPTSSQGTDGQEYVKYANYTYSSFYDGAIIIRENTDDSTDIKAFINGFTKSSNDYIEVTDANLLAYLSDVTAGKFKACDIYKQNDSTQYAFFFMNQNGTMYINTTNSAVSSRITGTFYDGMIDLNKPAISSATAYQKNGHQTIGGTASKRVNNAFLRKNDTWQDLIGSDIDDMILSVGGISILSGTSEPTASQGYNGQIYLKTAFDGGEDLSTGFSDRKENSMAISKTSDAITFTLNSGSAVGAQTYKQIDVTDIDEIKVTLAMGNKAYSNNYTKWHSRFYIENTANPSSTWFGADNATVPDAEISTAGLTQTFTIDVSNYTGDYWFVFSSNGCSSEVKALILDGSNEEELVVDAQLKANGSWQELVGSNIINVDKG